MVAKDEELKQDLILIDSCIHSLPKNHLPGDSIRDLFIPDRWRSLI